MPNWVITSFTFRGSENEIKDFHKKLIEWTSQSFVSNDFGTTWLGNILYGAGLGDLIDAKENRICCRGALDGWSNPDEHYDEFAFDVTATTAWRPMTKMWKATVEKLGYKTIKISYISEGDCGDGAVKYDPLNVYPYDWYVECDVQEEMSVNDLRPSEAFEKMMFSDDDFIKAVAFLLSIPEEELSCLEPDELIEKALSYHLDDEDNSFRIYRYETLTEGEAFSE